MSIATCHVLQTVKLSLPYVVVSTHCSHSEVMYPGLPKVGDHIVAQLSVALPDQVAAMLLGVPEPIFRLEPVQPAVVPFFFMRSS